MAQITQINNPTPAINKTEQRVQGAQTQYVELLSEHMDAFTDTSLGETRAFRSAAPCHWRP
jgi:hypothetical protein